MKAPHKAVKSPLGHAVPIKARTAHWSWNAPNGRKAKSSIIVPAVTITPGQNGFVIRRASQDKTVMGVEQTFQAAKAAAFNMGFRHLKVSGAIRELSVG